MIDNIAVDLAQFNVYNYSVSPLTRYYETHHSIIPTELEIQKLIPYAKQTDFILETFQEIIDNLNYDKDKFENIIYTFDDDYDILKEFISKLNPSFKSHNELLEISNKILTNLIKVQNELGIIVSQNDNKRI